MLLETILAAVLSLPVYKEDRSAELADLKAAQLQVLAEAVHDAAVGVKRWPGSKWELAALMIVVARHESGLSLRIGAGHCKPHECDKGLARGYWQQHASSASTPAAWVALAGLDGGSTRHAAREAARAIARARWMCRSLEPKRDWVEMTLAGYAGRGCVGTFRGRDERVRTYRQLMAASPNS